MTAIDYDLAAAARSISEPARAAMLLRLMDGQAHTASDLAAAARIAPSTASGHLRLLIDAGLVVAVADGRRRLHRLASVDVATAIEALAAISPLLPVETLRQAQAGSRLQIARVCYSHLGGRLSVDLAQRLVLDGVIGDFDTSRVGVVRTFDHALLRGLGITAISEGYGPHVRGCLDWTEQAPHVAGRFGSAVLTAMLERRWLARRSTDRALTVTETGRNRLAELGITTASSLAERKRRNLSSHGE